MLDNVVGCCYNGDTTKVVNKITKERSKKMEKKNLTVGSQFVTAKSGVVGTIQEVVQNKSGSYRVRLDVNGQPRWTTVK
jgi:preprotein translocase subunit YajC